MSVLDSEPSESSTRAGKTAPLFSGQKTMSWRPVELKSRSQGNTTNERSKSATAHRAHSLLCGPSRRLHSLSSNLAADALELFDERHDLLEHTLFLRHIFRVERAQSRQRLVQIRTVFACKLLSERRAQVASCRLVSSVPPPRSADPPPRAVVRAQGIERLRSLPSFIERRQIPCG